MRLGLRELFVAFLVVSAFIAIDTDAGAEMKATVYASLNCPSCKV